MSLFKCSLLLAAAAVTTQVAARKMDSEPLFPTDPNTTPHCTWWGDYDGSGNCASFLTENLVISTEDFLRWNPSVPNPCVLQARRSYCVEAFGEPSPGVPTLTTITTTAGAGGPTTTAPPTTTKPDNGVSTPLPTQPGMVTNCNKFHYIASTNVKCEAVISYQKISRDDFLKWNPTVKSDCSGMQIGVQVCVGVIAEPTPTTSVGPNGITTPLPIQPSMVSNCNKFHWIANSNVKCADVISYQKITLADFAKWNPSVNSDCTGMWSGVNVCVGVIGGTPAPTTTTSAGNGVQTPQPTQPGMVTNCNKFHWIAKGVSCDQVTSYQKISRADFVKWNPTVLSDCSGMWAEVNVCVGVIGGSPAPTTTTTAGNGVQTPQPTQPGMVTNCNKFHWIAKGVNCDQVTSYQKISRADFVKWNPTVLSDCSGMWAEVNVCVGVIGGSPAPAPTTTTSAGNGIQTPQPTQPGMVTNCKKFHWIANSNVKCADVISYQKITLADFVRWNTGVGADCRNMWAGVHQCVGV